MDFIKATIKHFIIIMGIIIGIMLVLAPIVAISMLNINIFIVLGLEFIYVILLASIIFTILERQ